ncbi:hypothetical protein LTR93_012108 [Exophiala xenobiotica]|nr:hypothetical protein LTR93_012108 [Exophiala xenobiotica]
MERVVHRLQLAHLAHLYGAGDLMNWLYPSLHNGLEAENARQRMAQWATEEPKWVREVAYHSAQILALVRQYPSNTPLEPSIIFHAGVVLAYDAMSSEVRAWVHNGDANTVSLHGVQSLCPDLGRQQVLD